MTTGKIITLAIQTFVGKGMCLLFNMLSRFVIAFLPKSKHLLISWLQSLSAMILEPKKRNLWLLYLFAMKWWDWIPWSSFFECWVLSQLFHSPFFTLIKRLCSSSSLSAITVVLSAYLRLLIFLPAILIPACDSSSLAFCMMYSAYKLNKKSDYIQPCHAPFPILNQSVVLCPVLTVASWPAYRFFRRQVRWSGTPISLRIFHSLLWSTQSKALAQSMKQMFFWNSVAFSMIQWMLAIWSQILLPFLNPTCLSGSSWFIYFWNLAWRLLSITLLASEMSTVIWWFHICLSHMSFTYVFHIPLLWDWNENQPFPVLLPLLSFPSLLTYYMQHFNNILF